MVNYTNSDFNIKELGSFYSSENTIFRVFAPESKEVYLILENQKIKMNKVGLYFKAIVQGDLEKAKYYFENDLGIKFKDPFAYYSDDEYSYVLDKSKFNSYIEIPIKSDNQIIYEVNVRDFSSDNSYIGKYHGKFLALGETDLKINDYFMIGLDYIRNIGFTHIQLMPVFAYDYDGYKYNWGYNPIAYNYLHKDYVVDVDNPYAYINEFRETINNIHKKGLRVTLDIVFNHVYNISNFDLDKMLGGHCFRKMDDGSLANGSLCGSEINSQDIFVRAYLIEMCRRYVELFDIDGLRIDLMGILDYETINIINNDLRNIKKDFIVYGEGWNMGDVLDESLRASIKNANKLPGIYMFNDFYRDNIINYVFGSDQIKERVKSLISGTNQYLSYKQSINYIECHDGFTFFDRLMKYKADDGIENNINRAKLGLSLVMISKGIPFIHMGQEFLRTKKMVENSYNSDEDINKIDWQARVKYNDICDYFKDLVELRNNHDFYSNNCNISDYYDCFIYMIDDLMIIINPSMWDYTYQDGNNYEVIFDNNGKNCYTFNVLSIPAYSIIVCKR